MYIIFVLFSVDLQRMPSSSTNTSLIMNQFRAMFLKKYTAIIRSKILLILQILMPTIFLLIAINVSKSLQKTGDLPSMPMTLDKFDDPRTLVQGENGNEYFQTYKSIWQNGLEHVTDLPSAISDYVSNHRSRGLEIRKILKVSCQNFPRASVFH